MPQEKDWKEELRKDFNSEWSPLSQHESVRECLEKVYPFIEKEIDKFLSSQAHALKKQMKVTPEATYMGDGAKFELYDSKLENAVKNYNAGRQAVLSAIESIEI